MHRFTLTIDGPNGTHSADVEVSRPMNMDDVARDLMRAVIAAVPALTFGNHSDATADDQTKISKPSPAKSK